jgi:YihY family inner membrane protein
MKRILGVLDRWQKRRRPAAVAVATAKKWSEDHSGNLAAMIAFWGFFSIFPLLLVLLTLLGWVLPTSDKATVLTHVAKLFPLLDTKTVTHLSGSTWALVVGLLTALWSGLGVVRTAEWAFDSVWEVPYHARVGTLKQVLRSVGVLATIGLGLVVSTLISGIVATSSSGIGLGVAGRVGGYIVAAALDVALVVVAFRILTTEQVSTRDVLPGGLVAGIAFFILQQASAIIISSHLRNAQSTYGHFATVITILWWFYLQAEITLLAAQLNVVLRERLWPRSIVDAPQTEADHRVLQAYAEERAYQPEEEVIARVPRDDPPAQAGRAGPGRPRPSSSP